MTTGFLVRSRIPSKALPRQFPSPKVTDPVDWELQINCLPHVIGKTRLRIQIIDDAPVTFVGLCHNDFFADGPLTQFLNFGSDVIRHNISAHEFPPVGSKESRLHFFGSSWLGYKIKKDHSPTKQFRTDKRRNRGRQSP